MSTAASSGSTTDARSAHASRGSAPRAVTTTQGVWLVAERELMAKLRSKSFLVSTLILVVIALAGVIFAGFQASSGGSQKVAVAAGVTASLDNKAFAVTKVADRAEAERLVKAGTVDAAVVPDEASRRHVTVIAETEAPQGLVTALSSTPNVHLLDPGGAAQNAMRYLLGIVFGLVFMMAALTFGAPITQSVVEEKQTRVVEILISAIPARVLLAGKVLGNTLLAMGQIVLLAAVAVVGLIVTGQNGLLLGLGSPIVWFAVFFLFGFVLLAGMFASAGALVSRQEDTGATLQPVMWLVMLPYFLVLAFGQNPLVMTVLSYVPFSAPVAMPVRLYFGDAVWWEPVLALALMVATCVVVVLLGAKIYQNSLLKMGARVKLADAFRG